MADNVIGFILINFQLFLLILTRLTGLFVISPIFSRANVPMTMKIGLAVTLSLILLPLSIHNVNLDINNIRALIFFSTTEFLIGIIIGFISFIYFSVVYLAGTVIDIQMGFGMVNIMDPQTNAQMPIMSGLYSILISLVFLTVNGHHMLIQSIIHSYEVLPIGFQISINQNIITHLTHMLLETFALSLQLSAPILISIFIVNVILCILARTMPQMNIFMVGMPLKIFIGIIIVFLSLNFFISYSEVVFDKMFRAIYEFMKILS